MGSLTKERSDTLKIAIGAFKDAISCRIFVSTSHLALTAAYRGRCFLWFNNNVVINQQDQDNLKIYMEILGLLSLLGLSQIARLGSGSGPEQSRSPLFITLVRPWTSVGLLCPGPGLHVPGCSQVSKIGRPPWNPTLFTSVPSSLPPCPSSPSLPQPSLQICCTAAVTLHCHNHNLFPAAGLLGTCILQAGGAKLC